MNRRVFASVVLAGALALGLPIAAHAQWEPTRPLNIIVPYNVGGGVDLYARAIANAAADRLPVPVVIVNKPGAGGMSGAIEAANARPDGNTILLHSSGSFLLGAMFKDVGVDPFESFQTIAQVGNLKGSVVVPAESPFRSIDELIEAAKDGGLRWGHNGRGGVFHVAGQTFLNSQEISAVDVPFKGGAASRAAILGQQVDFGILGIQQAVGFEDELRVLAVFDDERDALQPDVPTFSELGYDVPTISSPIILFAPNGVDEGVVGGMEAAMADITSADSFAETVKAKGTLPLYRTGEEAEAGLLDMQEAAQPVIDALSGGG